MTIEALDIHEVDICTDTRNIKKDDIFFCEKKAECFVDSSIIEIASCIYVEDGFYERNKNIEYSENITEIYSESRYRAKLVESLNERYKKPEKLIAITGTKGKTSTCWFAFQLLTSLGVNTSYFGTIGLYYSINGEIMKIDKSDYNMTTLSIDRMYKMLDFVAKQGVKIGIFEASSHGLHQKRIDGLEVDIAGFTNFTQDHLDYHNSMEGYFNAKTLLLSKYLKQNGTALLNQDIEQYNSLLDICNSRDIKIRSFGKENADIDIINAYYNNYKHHINLKIERQIFHIETDIIGKFQIENLALAILCVNEIGFSLQDIIKSISNIKPVIGRMQRIESTNIFIDYAHTPDSLEKCLIELNALKKDSNDRIITVFGCGGSRDKKKRPIMGCIAKYISDIVIITNDNPRMENPSDISNDILDGIKENIEVFSNDEFVLKEISKIQEKYRGKYQDINKNSEIIIELDRERAIQKGISLINNNDILLIAGKGHEDYQIFGDKSFHFSDYDIAKKIIINC